MIRVLLVDDDGAVRESLKRIIDASGEAQVVGEAWDGRSAVDRARSLAPDVVLMDIRMPGVDGIAATRMLRELPVAPAVLMLTTFGHDAYVESALKAGASGFLVKDAPPTDLLKSLQSVHAGHAVLAPDVTDHLIELTVGDTPQPADPDSLRLVESLTDRQRDILRLLAGGLSNAAIASELGLTEGTVKGHVSQVMERLGATNRVEAARVAFRAGL
ncbi:response regulator transcription factor [Streptomyces sp. NPDC004546]|uniref:response regulator transcription factor n=1 Tax=unclassified Streptomyces TaxID=2593676 RepID=UPI0033BD4831